MEKRISYYAVIPAEVRYDNGICPNAKLLYGEITALCNQEGFCWAATKYFAELYGVSKQTVINWINELEKGGYIIKNITYAADGKTIIQRELSIKNHVAPSKEILTTPSQKNLTTPSKKVDHLVKNSLPPGQKNLTNNNKYNTTSNNISSSSVTSIEQEREDDEDKNPQSELDFFKQALIEKLERNHSRDLAEVPELINFISWIASKPAHRIGKTQMPTAIVLKALTPITPKIFYEERDKTFQTDIGQREAYLLTCLFNRVTSGI